MSILYMAAVAAAVTLVPTPSDEPRQAVVQYNDLALSSSAGRESLDRRLKLALNMVCGRPAGKSFEEMVAIRKCKKRAMAEVEPQRAIAIVKSGARLAGGF